MEKINIILNEKINPDSRFVDLGERFVPAEAVIDKHEIKVHGQARHVTHEKIDRGAALQGKHVVGEYEWRYL